MQGRWTIPVYNDQPVLWPHRAFSDAERVPVVPCDDAAIERAALAISELLSPRAWADDANAIRDCRMYAERVLRAAQETP